MANFSNEKSQADLHKLHELRAALPPFCAEFFRGIEQTTSTKTRLAYACDFKILFTFMMTQLQDFQGKQITQLTLADLNKLSIDHIEQYLEYLSMYTTTLQMDDADAQADIQRENHDRAKARKLASLRALIKYFFKKQKLDGNIAALVDAPKLHDKPKVRLEANEVSDLLDAAEFGKTLSDGQKKYHLLTSSRDLAIVTLFLGTGIRISELVGMDLDDVDFENNAFRITRKGGNQDILYYSDEVKTCLQEYYAQRSQLQTLQGHEMALFLSLQKRRITDRAVQNMVKKYSSGAVCLKNITPHKLRTTFGTMLYLETGDIYLVANTLGHKDVNTTRKHYADTEEINKRFASRMIKLRD